jgi:hypothetical protein
MTKIVCRDDCDNAPRKGLLRDFNAAFANNDVEAILDYLAADIEWRVIGNRTFQGKEAVEGGLREMAGDEPAVELRIDHILTHGKEAALDGVLTFESGRQIAFCDVYVFSGHARSARIREMISYAIEMNRQGSDE